MPQETNAGRSRTSGFPKGCARMSVFQSLFQNILSVIMTISPFDVVDILIVAFLIYKTIQLVRETRAEQLIKGILLFAVVYYLSSILNLKAMSFILSNVFQFGVLALIVVFQPELRSALEHLGRSSAGGFRFFNLRLMSSEDVQAEDSRVRGSIYAVCEAAQTFQRDRTGALILFERATRLGEIVKTGTVVNADATSDLICNIFYPKAPLHDGAMIIRGGKVYAAGCFLPLSQNQDISRELGTRHRAAMGISESCDVLVVVVSEETGVISLVQHGVMKRNMTVDTLRVALEKGLLPEKEKHGKEGNGKEESGKEERQGV